LIEEGVNSCKYGLGAVVEGVYAKGFWPIGRKWNANGFKLSRKKVYKGPSLEKAHRGKVNGGGFGTAVFKR